MADLSDEDLERLAALPEYSNLHRMATELVHHRAMVKRLNQWAGQLVPHRPRLLDSPYRPSLEAITTARAGTGYSRGNDVL